MKNKLQVSVGEYTNKGSKEINQDFHDILIPKEPLITTKGVAMALADGISSSEVSQIASKTSIVSFLSDYESTPESWSVQKSAQRVLNAINSWLYAQSSKSKYHYDKNRGYVCTFSALIIRSNTAHIFHIGDTRIYRLRDNALEQLTEDHRLWVSQEKSYLSRALGIEAQLTIDYKSFQVQKDDVYFLMTDGVYEFVDSEFIIDALNANSDDFNHVAKTIAQKAYENGSDDNLTIELLRVDDLPKKDSDETYKQFEEQPFAPVLEARMTFEGYTVLKQLSVTSRSRVYLCEDNETKKSLVIKTPSLDLQNNRSHLERFMLEEWIAIRVNNPHVAKSYVQNRKRNFIYTVTEYIEGQTLTQWMIDNPKPSIETMRNVIEQIANGLQAFHRLEMIHQDIRPENILINNAGIVKIIDFGSTKIQGISDVQEYAEHENLLGTAQYSAPEYFLGKEGTNASDIFSLGVIAYQMLSAKLPYGANVAKSTTKKAQEKIKYTHLYSDENQIPLWIEEAIKKALAINPHNRYEELTEFTYDLRHPNREFLNKNRPPLYERNPLLVYKGISLVLFILLLLELYQTSH